MKKQQGRPIRHVNTPIRVPKLQSDRLKFVIVLIGAFGPLLISTTLN